MSYSLILSGNPKLDSSPRGTIELFVLYDDFDDPFDSWLGISYELWGTPRKPFIVVVLQYCF